MGYWPIVEDLIDNADIFLLILDARMPDLSRNKELERKMIQKNKEYVQVFNKIDLVNENTIKKLRKEYPDSFFVSGTKNLGIGKLRRHLHILGKRLKIESPRIAVIGYPNLGKSAVINALARRARALVADMPNTTKGVQWVNAGGLRILDSPGVIPYEDKSNKLVLLGSKHPEKIKNPIKIALEIIEMFVGSNKSALENSYKIKIAPLTDSYSIFLEIGKKRGFLKKGGEVEENKTAITIVKDWQKGKLIL